MELKRDLNFSNFFGDTQTKQIDILENARVYCLRKNLLFSLDENSLQRSSILYFSSAIAEKNISIFKSQFNSDVKSKNFLQSFDLRLLQSRWLVADQPQHPIIFIFIKVLEMEKTKENCEPKIYPVNNEPKYFSGLCLEFPVNHENVFQVFLHRRLKLKLQISQSPPMNDRSNHLETCFAGNRKL